ncbi:MAG: DM13 domain-containing protein [Pseudomonadota bacterium]
MFKKNWILAGLGAAVLAAATVPLAAQAADDVLHTGQFDGASGHVTSGGVSVVQTDNGIEIVFADDFFFDGAPDPHVAFGANGSVDISTELGLLTSNTGSQTYQVPASLDVSGYNEIYVWCVQYSVPLGVAALQ